MSWILSAFADEAGISTEEQIAALQKAGYHYIDPRAVEGHNISALPPDVAEAVRRKYDAAGIKVNMLGSPIGKIDIADDVAIDLDRLRHLASLKDILGCNAVRIFSYYNRKEERPLDQWQAEAVKRLRRLRDLAGELGMVLYHENERHIFGDRLEQNLVLAQELRDGTAFRLIFDFDNFNQSGDDVWNNWTRLADFVDAFHLKDSDKNNQHVPLGQGQGQAPRILTDAVKRGWQGPVVLEPHLKHSGAVAATSVSGQENQSYKEMSPADCFHHAAVIGKQVLADAGAKVI